MLVQGARQEQQMTRQGHKTDKTKTQDRQDKNTRPTRQGDRNTYSATSTDSDKDSDRRGENDNEQAKTIGHGAQ